MHRSIALLTIAMLALVVAPLPTASAHSTHDLGDGYAGTVGWLHEPPIVDEPNAAIIRLTGPADASGAVAPHDDGHDHHHGASDSVAISGQARNLSVTLRVGGQETTLQLRERHGAAGEYLADVIPTVPGVYNATYSFTVDGETHSFSVDLQAVVPPSAQAFPEETMSHYELQREIDALKEEVAALKAEAQAQSETPSGVTRQPGDDGGNGIPLPATGLVLVGIALMALAVSRQRR